MKLIYPPSGKIGVKILDLDMASVSTAEVREIKQLVYEYKLVIFQDRDISDLQYYEFALNMGLPQIDYYHSEYPIINLFTKISSQEKNLDISDLDQYRYTDGKFLEEPAPLAMVRTRMLPKSVRTIYYIDMEQVYQQLPAPLKQYLDGKNLIHEVKWYSQSKKSVSGATISGNITIAGNIYEIEERFSVVQHPAVVLHPVTETEILYMSSDFTTRIDDLDCETSQANLAELFAFIEQDRHIQSHTLHSRDIHLWDNRSLNHLKFKPTKERNSIDFKLGINDGLPFYFSSIKEAIKEAHNQDTKFKQ